MGRVCQEMQSQTGIGSGRDRGGDQEWEGRSKMDEEAKGRRVRRGRKSRGRGTEIGRRGEGRKSGRQGEVEGKLGKLILSGMPELSNLHCPKTGKHLVKVLNARASEE